MRDISTRPSAKWRLADATFPRTPAGDRAFHYLQFLNAHRRAPQARLSFNDVLFYIKHSGLIDGALRRFVSDKEYVKVYIAGTVGDRYNVPTLSILRTPEQVRQHVFSPGCIVKPTHASGKTVVVRGPARPDLDELTAWLDLDYYDATRERNYRDLPRKIIVEPLVFGSADPLDFKFHCFLGRVQFVHVDFDRATHHTRAFFSRTFERAPFSIGYPISTTPMAPPKNFDEMIHVAERLAAGFDFVRVDMYSDGEQIRVGELTNIHGNAHEPFFPAGSEDEFGHRFFQTAPRGATPADVIRL